MGVRRADVPGHWVFVQEHCVVWVHGAVGVPVGRDTSRESKRGGFSVEFNVAFLLNTISE